MKRTVISLAIPALLAAAVPMGAAWAQTPPDHREHHRPSADTLNRLQEGRIAAAKAALKLNDAQQKLWGPVEDLVRKHYADRASRRAEWEAKRADATKAAVPLPERLQKMSERMATRAAALKTMADTVAPLYASFSDEQKAVAGPVFAELFGRGHGHGHGGHRFGFHQQPGASKG